MTFKFPHLDPFDFSTDLKLFLWTHDKLVLSRHVGCLGPLVLHLESSRKWGGCAIDDRHADDRGLVLELDLFACGEKKKGNGKVCKMDNC